MIQCLGPNDLVKMTKGKVDSRGATVIFNILDEIKHHMVSVADLEKATALIEQDINDGKNKKGKATNAPLVTGAVNPEMIKELNNTLEIIFANTKRSNREAMQAAADEVVALIKKFS